MNGRNIPPVIPRLTHIIGSGVFYTAREISRQNYYPNHHRPLPSKKKPTRIWAFQSGASQNPQLFDPNRVSDIPQNSLSFTQWWPFVGHRSSVPLLPEIKRNRITWDAWSAFCGSLLRKLSSNTVIRFKGWIYGDFDFPSSKAVVNYLLDMHIFWFPKK